MLSRVPLRHRDRFAAPASPSGDTDVNRKEQPELRGDTPLADHCAINRFSGNLLAFQLI